MSDIEVLYAAGDRFLVQVRDHHIIVDQPRSAGGDDVGPTPTELFVASLGACVGFYAERFLRRHDLPAEGLKVAVDFGMSTDRPARVEWIDLRVQVPEGFPPARREALEAVVEHCTVHNSLEWPPAVRIELDERVTVPA